MNLIGQKVRSKSLALGIVIEQSNRYIVVEFETKISKFIYPDAFEKFLVVEDIALQNKILDVIENINKG